MPEYNPLPPLTKVLQKLEYDPATGWFTWKTGKRKGQVAGSRTKGYIQICINSRNYAAHRLAWLIMTGNDPGDSIIDHINKIRYDNRFENLRPTNQSGNSQNSRRPKTNTSGVKGMSYVKVSNLTTDDRSHWKGQVTTNGVSRKVTSQDKLECAGKLILLRLRWHGDYASHS